jgi:hypothetical protein
MARNPREIVFVCAAIKDNNLIQEEIVATVLEEAYDIFEKNYNIKPQIVQGPYYRKKLGKLNKDFDIRFKFGENLHGIYDGWEITAMPLINPANSVFVLFDRRVNGELMKKPQSIVLRMDEIEGLR